MRKIITVLLGLMLALSLGITAFAADSAGEGTTPIDVYARYVREIAGEYTAPAENGEAAVTLPDGSTITVTGAPQEARTLVVVPIPESEKEAWGWLVDCLANTGTPVRAYDIYFLDADGNRLNADGVVIAITAPSSDGTLIACSLNTDGISKVLVSAVNAGRITFTANGSHYYILAEKAGAAQPDDPDDTSTPDDPENPSKPHDPDDPSTPDDSDDPSTPDDPAAPSTPADPDNPSTPDDPSTPGNPSTSGDPTTPGNSSTPGNPLTPDDPSTPGNPSTPDEPSTPEDPSTSGNPSTSEASNPAESPKTGDSSNLLLWIVLLIISCAGILFLLLLGKRRKEKEDEEV